MTRIFSGCASVTIVFFFTLTAAAANPFSAYSSQWALPYFSEAGVNNFNPQLSPLEKEFMHALNLARMSPVLFVSTVFEPWCLKTKQSPFPYDQISNLYNTSSLRVIRADEFLLSLAGAYQPSMSSGNASGADSALLERIRPVSRYLLVKGDAEGAVGLLLHLMIARDAASDMFRGIFFSNNPLAGLNISSDGQGKQSLLMFSCSPEEHETMLNNNGIISLSPERRIVVDFNADVPLAAFMQEMRNGAFSSGNPVAPGFQLSPAAEYIGPAEFLRLKDSLEENKVLYQLNMLNFRLLPGTSAGVDGMVHEFQPDDWKRNHMGWMEPDAAFEKFIVHREIDVQRSSSEIRLITVSVPPPLPYLPPDSIGKRLPVDDFAAVDQIARNCDAPTPELLVKKLIVNQRTELNRVRALFMWMVSHLRYDYEGLAAEKPAVEVQEVWRKRVAICSGYAWFFNHLCKLAGIRSIKVSGMADGAELGPHAWNAVLIDGRYYLLDATWGEGYFLKAPEAFLQDHYPCVKRWSLLNSLPAYTKWLQPLILAGHKLSN